VALPPTDGGRLARAAVELGRCGRFDSSRRHSDSGRRCGGLQHHPDGVGRGSAGPREVCAQPHDHLLCAALFRRAVPVRRAARECRYHSASPLPGRAAAAPHQDAVHRIEPLPANTSGIGEHVRHWRTPQALANTSGIGEHLRHWRTPQALANTAHAADSVCRTTDLGRGRSSTGQRWAGSCARGDVAELGRRAAPGPGDLGDQRCARTSSPAHCSRGRHPRRKIAGGCSTISNGGAERFRSGCPTVCCPPVTRRAYGRGPGSTGP
jgi:hypothetical protein